MQDAASRTEFPPPGVSQTRVRKLLVQTREEWRAARRTGVTSSDAARIVGLAPESWGGVYEVFADKLGLVPDQDATEWQAWGTRLEPEIAKAYAEKYPHRKVSDPAGALFRSRQHAHLLATPDRWLVDPERGMGLLEVKNVTEWKSREWDGAEPPLYVQLQVTHQLTVLGFQWAAIAALIGGNRLVTFDLERSDEVASVWLERAAQFWALVERKTPPKPTGRDLRLLSALYGTAGTSVDLPADLLEVDKNRQAVEDQLSVINAKARALEAERDDFKATILGAMGEHSYGRLPGSDVVLERRAIPIKGYAVNPRTDIRLFRQGRHGEDQA